MNGLLVIVGALVGAGIWLAETPVFWAAATGAVAVYLLARFSELGRRLARLEDEVRTLRRRLDEDDSGTAPEPAAPATTQQAPPAPANPPARTPVPPKPAPAPSTSGMRARPSPARPDLLDRVVRLVVRYFTEGNLIVRIGVLVLLFGVAFLIQYAAQHTDIPVAVRLWSVALGGVALTALGWYLRGRRRLYALALQGGGLGVVYLTLFAAFRVVEVLPPVAAFGLMVLVVALACLLSLMQNAQVLAFLGFAGGFLAPVLISTGDGSHRILFSYYLLLNIGIGLIAWWRAWRGLNLLGFAFTFVIATLWGVLRYRPEWYASTQPFLLAFFVLYVAIAVLFALRQPPRLRGLVDGTLVFGMPLAAFALQAALVHDREYGLAWSAAVLGVFYGALAVALRRRDALQGLVSAFTGLAVGFGTLTIPFALDERWTAAAWSLEALGLSWVAVRQHRTLPLLAAVVIFLGAGASFALELLAQRRDVALLFLNADFLGGLLIALTTWLAAWWISRRYDPEAGWRRKLVAPMLFYGLAWLVFSGAHEIGHGFAANHQGALNLIYLTLWAALAALVQRSLDWPRLEGLPRVFQLVLIVLGVGFPLFAEHPLADFGLLAWPAAVAVHLGQLWLWQQRRWCPDRIPVQVVITAWLVVWLLGAELYWQVREATGSASRWPALSLAVVPLAGLLAALRLPAWPFTDHRQALVRRFAVPVAAFLLGWLLLRNLHQPAADGLHWPVVNPLDLLSLAILGTVWWWWRRWLAFDGSGPGTRSYAALIALAFFWFNAALLRTVHYVSGMPWSLEGIGDSVSAQAALSIAWTVLGLAAAIHAVRTGQRRIWQLGAALIAVVVVKLFLVELAGTGTLARVVSFLGVGLLLLGVGYFAPMPARTEEESR